MQLHAAAVHGGVRDPYDDVAPPVDLDVEGQDHPHGVLGRHPRKVDLGWLLHLRRLREGLEERRVRHGASVGPGPWLRLDVGMSEAGARGCAPRAREEFVDAPVDVPALRAWLTDHSVPGLDRVEHHPDGSTGHHRAVRTSGGTSTLEVRLPVDGGPVRLAAAGGDVPAALATARRWLGLHLDPAAGVVALRDDPVLGPLVRARPHVRVPGAPDPFETAVGVVLGQHVSVAAGRRFAGRLVAAHGEGEGPERVAPAAEVLAGLDSRPLQRDVGVTGARAVAVVALARAVAGGLVLGRTDDPDRRGLVRESLLALPGVGPWTADLVALRCLGDPDVFLPGDLVLRRALGGVSVREASRLAEGWRPHRSLAVVHLWTHHALDPPG